MFFNGDIKFKNISSKTYPLTVTSVPLVTHSEIRGDVITIPGRDGDLFSSETYRGNAEIKVSFAMKINNATASSYQTMLFRVRQWLSGTGKLVISDHPDTYYEVLRVTIATDDRVVIDYGKLDVVFTVYPFAFIDDADTAVTSFPISNAGDVTKPIYTITGSGTGTLTVNGLTMGFTATSSLVIDTRRQIAYDGNGNNCNGNLDGKYESLWLKTGSNSISITSGFSLSVVPKWGYTI